MNIRDAESAYLQGKARFDTWAAQFEQDWNKPQVIDAMRMVWATMPAEIKAQLQQANPAKYAELEKQLNGGK